MSITLTPDTLCYLPDSLRRLVELVGVQPVLHLVERCGGQNLRISRRMGDLHPVVLACGRAVADRLGVEFGGDRLDVPRAAEALRCLRNRELQEAYDAGVPVAELVTRYRLTERWVREILNRPLDGHGGAAPGGGGAGRWSCRSRKKSPAQGGANLLA